MTLTPIAATTKTSEKNINAKSHRKVRAKAVAVVPNATAANPTTEKVVRMVPPKAMLRVATRAADDQMTEAAITPAVIPRVRVLVVRKRLARTSCVAHVRMVISVLICILRRIKITNIIKLKLPPPKERKHPHLPLQNPKPTKRNANRAKLEKLPQQPFPPLLLVPPSLRIASPPLLVPPFHPFPCNNMLVRNPA